MNDDTLWDGYPLDDSNPDSLKALPEVRRAVEAASHQFVDMFELQHAAGKRLAEISGAEFGMVTSGAAAAIIGHSIGTDSHRGFSKIRRRTSLQMLRSATDRGDNARFLDFLSGVPPVFAANDPENGRRGTIVAEYRIA
jgi:hypothetical protein